MYVCNFHSLSHSVKEASVYGNPTGHGKSWHPPVGMHLVRGETLAYNYINVLLDAIYSVEKDLQTKSMEELRAGRCRCIYVCD